MDGLGIVHPSSRITVHYVYVLAMHRIGRPIGESDSDASLLIRIHCVSSFASWVSSEGGSGREAGEQETALYRAGHVCALSPETKTHSPKIHPEKPKGSSKGGPYP